METYTTATNQFSHLVSLNNYWKCLLNQATRALWTLSLILLLRNWTTEDTQFKLQFCRDVRNYNSTRILIMLCHSLTCLSLNMIIAIQSPNLKIYKTSTSSNSLIWILEASVSLKLSLTSKNSLSNSKRE
jgi:hypothetical protein